MMEEPRTSPTSLQAISAFPLDGLGCVGVFVDPQKQRPVSVFVGTFLAYPGSRFTCEKTAAGRHHCRSCALVSDP